MADLRFQIIEPGDDKLMASIAEWYLDQWKIPMDKTIQKLKAIAEDSSQFQIVMNLRNIPVATGGLYHHVGLLDQEPRFRIYKNWLALVYTIPPLRSQGIGAQLCNHIADRAKDLGVQEMYLFTDTAEHLYARLGWTSVERLAYAERKIVVMRKDLFPDLSN